jgi:hypothetical protein
MITISHETDVSKLVEEARNHVRGKSFQEALLTLALLGASTDISELRQQVQRQAHDMLSNFFPVVMMNKMGKVVARQPDSALSSDSKEAEATIYFEMCRNAINYQSLRAQAYIEPARYQITAVIDWVSHNLLL